MSLTLGKEHHINISSLIHLQIIRYCLREYFASLGSSLVFANLLVESGTISSSLASCGDICLNEVLCSFEVDWNEHIRLLLFYCLRYA